MIAKTLAFWKNLSENLIIFVISALIGGVIGVGASVYTSNHILDNMETVLIAAIEKHSTNTEVTNDIELKNKKGETNVVLDGDAITTLKDSSNTPEKKGILKWFTRDKD